MKTPEQAERYAAFLAEQRAERERLQAEQTERLYSCWSCGCSGSLLCADHVGPLRPHEGRSLQGGKNEKNPAGASLRAMRSIWDAFPSQAIEIIASLRWHGTDRMWSFLRWGHFVGVELDGEIHS